MSFLSVSNVSFHYGKAVLLKSLSFALEKGEIGCLLGASGSGKTTILRILLGCLRAQSGCVSLNGRCLTGPTVFDPPEARGIGMVFQGYSLFPHMTVLSNVTFGLRTNKRAAAHSAHELLELLGLSAYADRFPHELSGGEQQRVALARALAIKPELILFDEPLAHLDEPICVHFVSEIRDFLKRHNITALWVTHDRREAFQVADRIGVLHKGQLDQWGSPEELYKCPQTAYIGNFMASHSCFIAGKVRSDAKIETMFGALCTVATHLKAADEVQVLIRPHQIRPAQHGEHAVQVVLLGKRFLGNQYQLRVLLNKQMISILTPEKPLIQKSTQLGITLTSFQEAYPAFKTEAMNIAPVGRLNIVT